MCHGEACASLPGPKSRFIRLGRPSTPLIVLLCRSSSAPTTTRWPSSSSPRSSTSPPPSSCALGLAVDHERSYSVALGKTGPALGEKQFHDGSPDPADRESLAQGTNTLHKSLKGRHMQMIAM